MTALFVLLATAAFGAEPPATVADRVDDALAARHDVGCPTLVALGDTAEVRAALVAATRREAPPWAPLRAASCLTDMSVTDAPSFVAVRDLLSLDGKPGLALAVVHRLDGLDSVRAAELGDLALIQADREPRLGKRIRPVLERSAHESVRMLVPVSVGVE